MEFIVLSIQESVAQEFREAIGENNDRIKKRMVELMDEIKTPSSGMELGPKELHMRAESLAELKRITMLVLMSLLIP